MNYKEIMVFFLEPELGDILFMLDDYMQKADEALNMFGEPEDDNDQEIQDHMKANLAVAIRLEEMLMKEFKLARGAGQ